ncbi:MAG: tRNA (adenosine(37)-N6)-threonylcarbamoyltransferase complex transferase subunit TsaD [Candidatus Wallbacteria bacterium HGW-Wallbacteria-1]|uniref:tRNA N6-adenosine threonylcarbamoyltransferase n=1 Tax=Candidatus Wallbacteria bacterium HGW-Wallbacteria-1 TaxID=2013854 RepID=A0A2N1PU16_9BACT|nr:MAG: tRNA (adenosine(37)-N6)-threonylcarbamoyltransferase complex transferase subunit TsaD [Candidatus Wallbacteria bacterium HGW-Wallbacteria-1]
MKILAIETSCDETAAAIVEDGINILSNIVVSQVDLHALYGGVVPEIASRNHLVKIGEVVNLALREAGLAIESVDALAVTNGPGLVGALLVGLSYAKALAWAKSIPLIPVNHIEAHIYSAFLARNDHQAPLNFPCLALVVSGGHTSIYRLESLEDFSLLGATRDDAAGEAFDKIAQYMGLPYPGGPSVSRAAQNGTHGQITLPMPLHDSPDYDFSFSGLKTAAINYVLSNPGTSVENLSLAFEEAVAGSLMNKFLKAIKKEKPGSAVLCGGVAANRRLREAFQQGCSKRNIPYRIPPLNLCTDNAAMVAGLAFHRKADPNYLIVNAYSTTNHQIARQQPAINGSKNNRSGS